MQKDMRSLVFVYDEAGLFCFTPQQQKGRRGRKAADHIKLEMAELPKDEPSVSSAPFLKEIITHQV